MQLDFLKNEKNTLHSGATAESLQSVEAALSVILPRPLKDFLTFSDGALLSDVAIFFSAKSDTQNHEDILSFNNKDTVQEFLRIGRFSADEFGYKSSDLSKADPAIFVIDHETGEMHKEADNMMDFLKKYNNYIPPKKKWYSFLFS